jgi:hypothetical protein
MRKRAVNFILLLSYRMNKHNRSGMVAVLGPFWALPCYIHTYRMNETYGDAMVSAG